MASSWNEDWEEIRNRCSRKYNITLWTNTTCENGLQPKWGLGGGLVWPSSSSIVTLWEFFLLIWILEACTRSIFLNMSTLQCNFFPGSAFVSQFPTFWGIGNPTDFQVSWGTWLGRARQGPSFQLLMLRRVPWPPESGCRKCRGPKKCLLNLKLPMSGFCSRPVYLKTSLTRNSFTQITGTPSKPELKARGAVTNLWATKVQTFPVLCKKYQAIVNSFI